MADTYAVCETIENEAEKYFTVVPCSWTFKGMYKKDWGTEKVFGLVGNDIMKYSDKKTIAVRNLINKAKRDPCTIADDSLLDNWRCTIIYKNFSDFKSVCFFILFAINKYAD